MSRKLVSAGSGLAALLVVVCIAAAANVILGNLRLRKDLTEERIYTLSAGTRDIVRNLEQPVTLKFFFNESDAQIPVFLKSYGQRVADLLAEYEIAARGNVRVEKYDPKPDSDYEDWAQRYGLSGQPVGMMGPRLYMGIVAVLGDAEAAIPMLDPQAENLLEYEITRLITRVARPQKPVLGVLSSLPVLGARRPPYPMPGMPPPSPAWVAFGDLRQDYTVRELAPTVSEIDADVDALVVVHPKTLGDETLFAIDQFLLRGGRLMVFVDPLCLTDAESQQMPGTFGGQRASNLEKLMTAWGVSFEAGKVVADLDAVSRLRMGDGGQIDESPVWLSLRRQHLDRQDAATAQLESIMMPYAGAFKVQAVDGLKASTLIASSKDSGAVDAMTAQFSLDGVRRAFKNEMARKDLAVRLSGTFKTAFPDGKPAKPEEPKDGEKKEDEAKKDESAPSLKVSAKPSSVLLVGDVDMLYDRYCVQEVNVFGYKAYQPMNDNRSFFLNSVDQLAGNPALVAVRTRGKTERPFTVVQGLERRAQERYMLEETRLQQRLEEAQRRLSELQTSKDASQRFILSADQKREIEDFQKEVAGARQELKLVRRKLREDIEALGIKVKILNILAMPLVVGAAGVAFGVYRRQRTRS